MPHRKRVGALVLVHGPLLLGDLRKGLHHHQRVEHRDGQMHLYGMLMPQRGPTAVVTTELERNAMLAVIRDYRLTRDSMASPLNINPPTHLKFVEMCNTQAKRLKNAMPNNVVIADVILLYDVALGVAHDHDTSDTINGYTDEDKTAMVELCGCLLAMMRRTQ